MILFFAGKHRERLQTFGETCQQTCTNVCDVCGNEFTEFTAQTLENIEQTQTLFE